jgi:hypothetical protein
MVRLLLAPFRELGRAPEGRPKHAGKTATISRFYGFPR